jgi:hypothetical protein
MPVMNPAETPRIECHPPERRRRADVHMCHGSCCCCCCCLHTLGGIVGAVIAPKLGGRSTAWSHLSLIEYWEEEDDEPGPTGAAGRDAIIEEMPISRPRRAVSPRIVPNIAGRGVSAVKVFWLLSLAASIVGALIGLARGSGGGLIVGLIVLLLVFPAVQLLCAVITLTWLALSSRPDQSFQLRQVGKLTLGLFLGTLAGIVAMVGIGALMSLH